MNILHTVKCCHCFESHRWGAGMYPDVSRRYIYDNTINSLWITKKLPRRRKTTRCANMCCCFCVCVCKKKKKHKKKRNGKKEGILSLYKRLWRKFVNVSLFTHLVIGYLTHKTHVWPFQEALTNGTTIMHERLQVSRHNILWVKKLKNVCPPKYTEMVRYKFERFTFVDINSCLCSFFMCVVRVHVNVCSNKIYIFSSKIKGVILLKFTFKSKPNKSRISLKLQSGVSNLWSADTSAVQ